MLIDELGLLRADGAVSAIDDTEDGYDSLEREEDTGQAVIAIYKTGKNGIPVVVITDPSDTCDRGFTVTIEACDLEDFASGEDVVATFPETGTDGEETLMVRRVHTQKRYLRSVITLSDAGSAGTCDFLIFIGTGLMDT